MDVATQHKYESIMRTEIDILAQKAWAREEGFNEGETKGRKEGEAKGHADVARNLRDMKVPVE